MYDDSKEVRASNKLSRGVGAERVKRLFNLVHENELVIKTLLKIGTSKLSNGWRQALVNIDPQVRINTVTVMASKNIDNSKIKMERIKFSIEEWRFKGKL
eukprot:TRINITY_DN12888_c0_g1_i1.p1 TRINITY_DN12888_c0_g1~~TRINITY_DN12888_c0_g1_i1.p1  ORF type:complete len:114 (+),score=20.70 TRINITY_DN12888_c0_g1_i1:44-343(+)